ncbi:elongin-A [Argentina anserina]|uniref:elongin-A n=1 Tax=Argentina anserina TaxID=57926 RepID=UPI00217679AE|nr:elongin-A [Potentilla anserina]XP_050380321.1 elongin-A [Potentilla anserina]
MDGEFFRANGKGIAAPSLVELCIHMAIDNIRYLGDVGGTDFDFLEQILPHCTKDQLMHIEKSTKGRDLSPVTDELWKKFYEKDFGIERTNMVIKRMEKRKVNFRWLQLYQAKLREVDEAENEAADRLKNLYKKEDARKQSRQVRICEKVPPSSNKRRWGGGGSYNVSNTKSNLLKKAKLDYLKSPEVRNAAVMKRTAIQRSAPPIRNSNVFSGNQLGSSSKQSKPIERTFKPKKMPF